MYNAFYRRSQKSIFNNTKFAIFGDKYLSQDLIVILGNTTPLCQVRQRGVVERGRALQPQTAGVHEHLPGYHQAMTQCFFNVGATSETAGQHYNNIGSMPCAVTAD